MNIYKITDKQNILALTTWFEDAVLKNEGTELHVSLTQDQVHSLKRDHGIEAHPVAR